MAAKPLDWPLSHEEKKGCVMRLFDKDVRAANDMIRSGEEKLQALKEELEEARAAVTAAAAQPAHASKSEAPAEPTKKLRGRTSEPRKKLIANPQLASGTPVKNAQLATESSEDAAEKLRAAIASATAALAALEGRQSAPAESELANASRSRSEGPKEAPEGILCSAARRHSRARSMEGMKRRVSFGDLPKAEDNDTLEDISVPFSIGAEPEPEQELAAPEPLREEDVVPSVVPWRPGTRLEQAPRSCAADEKSAQADEKSAPASLARGPATKQQTRAPITPRRSRPKEQDLASSQQSVRPKEETRQEDTDSARPRRVWRKGKVDS